MDRFDPFVKYADVYGDIINWEKDPMNKPQNQNKYFFSDGKTYYEQICKMLRLMSVFKEAFNQIYNNEDEISDAWENFVNNLSASVVEGSEPDVTLTWTDDSVNFEFTMVPGVPGEQGVGITSISFNSDYTMTITLSDGNTYTSMSLKGETGPQGPQGETGSGLQILDVYATLADLQSAHPSGQPGDAYQVGSAGNYTLYIWSSSQSAWVPAGSLGTVSPSLFNPLMDGTASAGSLNQYSRGDHVHPTDTSRASQEELDALIKTSQSLIDQSFTYRESPAIQDGLARIDRIKGNTIVWNQSCYSFFGLRSTLSSAINSQTDITCTASSGQTSFGIIIQNDTGYFNFIGGHTYVLSMNISEITVNNFSRISPESALNPQTVARETGRYTTICNPTVSGARSILCYLSGTTTTSDKFKFNSVQIIDLTMLNDSRITDYDSFKTYYPLDYYSYNQGSLLSFNGNGIKTVGKNLFEIPTYSTTWAGLTITSNKDDGIIIKGTASASGSISEVGNYVKLIKGKTYTISGINGGSVSTFYIQAVNEELTQQLFVINNGSYQYTPTQDETIFLRVRVISGAVIDTLIKMQCEIGSTPTEYEPYTSHTTNLPISTYFPTGMKSAGNVYDELTETKAITRIGSRAYQSGDESDTSVITDGTNTYYVLDAPTETDIDLDLSFTSYENGTEQLLPINGSVPATSPVIADMAYLSIDDAMEYIIDKLANVPQNTQQILDSLEDDVADLQTDVGALQPAVSALQTSVGNINTNIGQLSSTVAGHTASISDMQSDISDMDNSITSLEGTVTNNSSKIGTLETGLSTTNGNVQNLSTSVSDLDSTVTAQGETVTSLDNFVSNIANTRNPGYMSSDNSIGITSAFLNMTLAAGQSTWANIPLPTIMAGFIPLFVVGASTGDGSVCLFKIPSTYNQNNIYKVGVKNTSNSEVTTQVGIEILCIKQRQSQ